QRRQGIGGMSGLSDEMLECIGVDPDRRVRTYAHGLAVADEEILHRLAPGLEQGVMQGRHGRGQTVWLRIERGRPRLEPRAVWHTVAAPRDEKLELLTSRRVLRGVLQDWPVPDEDRETTEGVDPDVDEARGPCFARRDPRRRVGGCRLRQRLG